MEKTLAIAKRLLLFLSLSTFLQAAEVRAPGVKLTPRQECMLNDLAFIKGQFQINYAPTQWKKERWGWDLDAETAKIKSQVLKNPALTTKEFQQLIKGFCNEAKDYHVSAQFYSTESATLPFIVQSAEDRYFVSYIDPLQTDFSAEVGDELVLFDGQPVSQIVDEIRRREIGNNHPGTDQALAEMYLTTRLGILGHEVPKGLVEMAFRKAHSKSLFSCRLEWNYQSEKITGAFPKNQAKSLRLPKGKPPAKASFFQKPFTTPHYSALKSVRDCHEITSNMLGAKKGPLPLLGEVLWQPLETSEFHAYLFSMPSGKTGGYVRIPTYYTEAEKAATDFTEIIQVFQEKADVLVIDQLNNPGGLVLYLYALLSMLSDQPLYVPLHRIMLTQEDVYFAAREIPYFEMIENDEDAREMVGDSIEGLPATYEMMQRLLTSFRFIVQQWSAGKLFTDFHYLYGIDRITPCHTCYTKPILVLVNSMDFSAGDFFPAIMQDNHRAKVMGTRTAGAGGYIEKVSFPNLNGVEEINLTASFSERAGHRPIENCGVSPDVLYEVTPLDLQNNYVEYVQRILDELEILSGSHSGLHL